MMNDKICFFLMFVLLAASPAIAQTTNKNISIESESVMVSEDKVNLTSKLRIAGNTFIWQQFNREKTLSTKFSITQTFDDWDGATSTGSFRCLLQHQGNTAEFEMAGDDRGVTATLTYYIEGTALEVYVFSVSALNFNN